jgi:ParB-like chromosome segregation protein Spo0J
MDERLKHVIDNIRASKGNDDEIRALLKAHGWRHEFPALVDEHGAVLVGHRRLRIAEELGISPVIQTLTLGAGKEADAERLKTALLSNIGQQEVTTADRKRIAEKLYQDGWTQQQIGDALGVSRQAVTKYLEVFNLQPGCNSKREKSDTNPRGAGRHKKPPGAPKDPPPAAVTPEQEVAIAKRVLDDGEAHEKVRMTYGVSDTVVRGAVSKEKGRREERANPEIDPSTLSLSAQQKLTAAIAQYKKKLEASFADEVQRRVTERMKEALDDLLPEYQAKLRRAEQIIDSRTGIMSRADFRKVWACLHPDGGASEKMRTEAFGIFAKHEDLLVKRTEDERKMPGPVMAWPRTYEEAMKMKAKVRQERRAKRGSAVTKSRIADFS